jgi:hypothetical protein
MFAEFGALGLAVMVALVVLMIRLIIAGNRYRRFLGWRYDFVLSVVIYGFVNAQFSGDLPIQQELWFGLGLLGGIVRLGQLRQQQEEEAFAVQGEGPVADEHNPEGVF